MLNRPVLILLKDKKNLVGAEIGVAWGCNALDILKELDIKKLYLEVNCAVDMPQHSD